VPIAPGSSLVRRRLVVRGQVQGVWFRDSCRREALAAGVGGFVRNLWDGSVEAVFEGAPAAVAHMVGWCRTGPPRARVESVEVTDEDPVGEVTFKVL